VIPGVFGGFRSYIILGVHGIIVLKSENNKKKNIREITCMNY
jgi:hypothetical protein